MKEHLLRVTRRLEAIRTLFANEPKPRTVYDVMNRLRPQGFIISRGQAQRDLKELEITLSGY